MERYQEYGYCKLSGRSGGRENVKIYLKDHPEICDEIEKQVRIQYHLLPEEENAAKEADKAAASAETEEE